MPAAPTSDGVEAVPISSDGQSEAGHQGARIKAPAVERERLSREKNLFSQPSSGPSPTHTFLTSWKTVLAW